MDWKTFVVQTLNALAWPIVVAFLILQLKDKLDTLLPRLKKIKHKDTELEFIETIIEKYETKEKEPEIIKYESKETKHNETILYALANISSRSALIEAYRLLEVAAVKASIKTSQQKDDTAFKNPSLIGDILFKNKIITENEYIQFQDLRAIRNFATHKEDFDVKYEAIESYINTSLSILDKLETYLNS